MPPFAQTVTALRQLIRRHGTASAGGAVTVACAGFLLPGGENYASSVVSRQAMSFATAATQRATAAASQRTQSVAFSPESKLATDIALKRGKSTAALPPPISGGATGNSQSFLQWYEGHLQERPVQTKMLTSSLLWGLGDVVAQVVPPVASDGASAVNNLSYDLARTGRAAFFGFAIHAPFSHLHFNFLEWMTVRAGVKGLGIPVFKAFMEQFVYWSWFSNTLYHGAMGAMQGHSMSQIEQRIKDVLWETQKAQWVFWIPVQLLNFRFVPVRHQLNVVLLTSVVWTALLSAWYPPCDEFEKVIEEEKKEQ